MAIKTLNKIAQQDKYQIYINEHIENVTLAWMNLKCISDLLIETIVDVYRDSPYFNPSSMYIQTILDVTESNIRVHDASKRGPEEFEYYRKNFYPVNDKEKEDNKEDFEKAWKHHYENNMHHWDYWAKSGNKEKMPIPFVLEMCCDWIAMSMKYNNANAIQWYNENKNDIVLGKYQQALVEKVLRLYYGNFDVKGKPLPYEK